MKTLKQKASVCIEFPFPPRVYQRGGKVFLFYNCSIAERRKIQAGIRAEEARELKATFAALAKTRWPRSVSRRGNQRPD